MFLTGGKMSIAGAKSSIACLTATTILVLLTCSFAFSQTNILPYGDVKTWVGKISVEVTSDDRMGDVVHYTAAGKVDLTDEMMPPGSHYQWPLVAGMGMSEYRLNIELPELKNARCTGTRDDAPIDRQEEFKLKISGFEVTGPFGPSGSSIVGTKDLEQDGCKIKVTYSLDPVH